MESWLTETQQFRTTSRESSRITRLLSLELPIALMPRKPAKLSLEIEFFSKDVCRNQNLLSQFPIPSFKFDWNVDQIESGIEEGEIHFFDLEKEEECKKLTSHYQKVLTTMTNTDAVEIQKTLCTHWFCFNLAVVCQTLRIVKNDFVIGEHDPPQSFHWWKFCRRWRWDGCGGCFRPGWKSF